MSTKVLGAAAVAAPLVLAAATVVMLAAAPAGRHPLWQPEAFNMTEAAAARDIATVAASVERGEDPNVRRPVRSPLLDDIGRELTPLEAAVIARRFEIVDFLLSRGASPDGPARAALICHALGNGDRDIADALAAGAPAPECAN